MKTDIETLKDSFHMGYDAFYESRVEADEIWNLYHNRQWTVDQANLLDKRGQPKETFNVVKLFARMLVGYYSTVVNTVRAEPTQVQDQTVASLMTDTINSVFASNRMETEGDEVKLTGIVSGLMCAHVEPVYSGERDEFNRPLYEIRINQVYDYELVLDPMSTDPNYEDARFLHRFKWVPEETIRKVWGEAKLKELTEYDNFLEVDEAEFEYAHGDQFQGRYRVFDNYLVVQTVIEDDKGKRWNIWWSGEVELERREITFKEVKWPYRVTRLHKSSRAEYYGIFREVKESQKAINQALVKLQLMINTQKVYVESTAVKSIDDFTDAANRVNGIIEVKSLKGLRVENLSRDALEQYAVIDRAFDRIQRVLSINDSFLGQAFASDSGRKVKLQQNATVMALRYLTVRIEAFYELLGQDVVGLVKQYYTAHQTLRVTDELVGRRYLELNKPMTQWSGQMDPQTGEPIMEPVFEQVFSPETGEPEEDEEGNLVFAPIPEEGTEFAFTKFDMSIESVAYNDEDERSQLMLEQVLSGNVGTMLSQINPAGYFQAAGLTLRTFKTKYSPEVSRIFQETAQMLQAPAEEEGAAVIAGQQPQQQGGSAGTDTKLPTNTNEGPE